jgi:hypothetical protein
LTTVVAGVVGSAVPCALTNSVAGVSFVPTRATARRASTAVPIACRSARRAARSFCLRWSRP